MYTFGVVISIFIFHCQFHVGYLKGKILLVNNASVLSFN